MRLRLAVPGSVVFDTLGGTEDAAIEAHWQAVEVTHVTPERHTDADLFTVLES
jgi:hypothetical protein